MYKVISKPYLIRDLLKHRLRLANHVFSVAFQVARVLLTEFVKVCVYAVRSWYGANDTSFLEGAPFMNQTSLTTNIILGREEKGDINTLI